MPVRRASEVLIFCAVLFILLSVSLRPTKVYAIPAFSRQYQTSCATCHLDFPKLNDFGKAFKDAGFKFPKDDADFLKIAPTLLGAEAQKQVWPKAIWPGTIPGIPPIGLRMNNYFQWTGNNRNMFNSLAAPGTVPPVIPGTDFETGFFSIFTAGNFGSDIAFWVDDDISVAGANSNGGLGDGYLRFVNVSRFLKLPTDSLHIRVGQFELDLPITQARNINISPYDIYAESNVGAISSILSQGQNVNNLFNFTQAAKGVEISGGHTYGGYHYSVAIIDQNTSGLSQTPSPYIPSATGGANGGVGFASDSTFKDVYARFSYRFNLERDPESRHAIQAAGTTGPHDHTYLSLGTFYLHGKSQQSAAGVTSTGASTIIYAREPYYRAGGDFNFNYRTFNLFGVYMFAKDTNLLPVTAGGLLIPVPLSSTSPPPVGFITGVPAKFSGGFVEADYLVLPWIMLIGRWDTVHSSADQLNGLLLAPNTSYFGPLNSVRNRYSPAIQFLIHPNIKASFEYQIRPKQIAAVLVDPVTGALYPLNPFRTNTAVFGLEFVY
jgi:hypothetical protein